MAKQRYVLAFDQRMEVSDVAAFLRRPSTSIRPALRALRSTEAFSPDDALHFRELGIVYADLDQEEASSIREVTGVKQVRSSKQIFSRPLVVPEAVRPTSGEVPWNINLVSAPTAWRMATGKGVKVGIIDSGITKGHPDVPVVDGVCTVPELSDWDDNEDGHGTQCAGIVGARNNGSGVVGVAPECELYAIKVSRNGRSNTEWMVAGMMWAVEKKLDVVSISLWDIDGASSPDEEPWEDMVRASEYCVSHGCSVVGIAGNSGGLPNHWVTNPARAPGFIAVGSVTNGPDWSEFSSWGPETLSEESAVEIAAPGSNITSTTKGGGYAGMLYGTSYACPHVTGAIALIKQLHPEWSPTEIRRHLKATADDLFPQGRDEKTGFGVLNCARAVGAM